MSTSAERLTAEFEAVSKALEVCQAARDTAQAEVERLRADLKLYKEARERDIERANKAVAREDKLANDFAAAAQEINGLRAANEQLHSHGVKMYAELTRAKATLEWFEKCNGLKDTLLTALMEHNKQAYNWVVYRELSRWRQANPEPKPEGT